MDQIKNPSPKLSQHPLMGVRLNNLFNVLSKQTDRSNLKWHFPAIFAAAALGRTPFTLVDWWKASNRKAANNIDPPVFIVGYWRSGTTHLHNLLAQSSAFGIITPLGSGLPDELLSLSTWLRPLLEKGLPKDRGIDDVAVSPHSPQEDEIPLANLQPLSVFHALYFPANFEKNFQQGVFFDDVSPAKVDRWKDELHYFLGKVALHQNKQPLLIKNPVYTARIKLLRSLWPDARFVHIRRNPYRVYCSTMHYYPQMLHDLALQPYNWEKIKPVIVDSYPRMLDQLYADTEDLSDRQMIEISFEKLERQPLEMLERIYTRLALPAWPAAKKQTQTYLKSIADYEKNDYQYTAAHLNEAETHWGKYIERWGYQRPV